MLDQEKTDLRGELQRAVLGALIRSRSWVANDLAFQGGTCLHLAYASPRLSEDLDLMVRRSIDLDQVRENMEAHLKSARRWYDRDLELTVTPAKTDKNPYAFNITLSGRNVVGQAFVKVEFLKTDDDQLAKLTVDVSTIAGEPVPVLMPEEIYLDKVMALGGRRYLKARDVFDLHFLRGKVGRIAIPIEAMRGRIAIYPADHPGAWIPKAEARIAEMPTQLEPLRKELGRFLSTSYPLDNDRLMSMVASAVDALNDGVAVMGQIEAEDSEPTENEFVVAPQL